MCNQSTTSGSRARHICPAGVNWIGDSGFKLLLIIMVPFDERGGVQTKSEATLVGFLLPTVINARSLTKFDNPHSFIYHLSSRMLVECALGRLKGRFKILHGVTNRRSHRQTPKWSLQLLYSTIF